MPITPQPSPPATPAPPPVYLQSPGLLLEAAAIESWIADNTFEDLSETDIRNFMRTAGVLFQSMQLHSRALMAHVQEVCDLGLDRPPRLIGS